MANDLSLLIIGWALGLLSSLATSILLYWLEGKREIRNEIARQRHEDIRLARNWSASGKSLSLKGFDLSGANLSSIDLSGADLEDANLSYTQLWNTNLTDAKLIRANFRGATIQGAKFIRANMHSALFTDARIKKSDFSEALLRRTNFSKVRILEDCNWANTKIDETTLLTHQQREAIQSSLSLSEVFGKSPLREAPELDLSRDEGLPRPNVEL